MKKAILLIIASTAAALSLNAQISVRISAGAASGLITSPSREFVFDRPQTLYGIYGELYVLDRCTPVYQVDVSKQIGEIFQSGVGVAISNATGYTRGVNNVNNLTKKRVHDYLLVTQGRAKYYSGGDFYLYGGCALGGGYRHIEEHNHIYNSVAWIYELSPIGIHLGTKRVGFFVEGAIGSLINGCRVGIKYTI